MGEAKYKDLILDAIDQLRKRKARPDLERICHMLERKHGLHVAYVQSELQRLVDQGVVVKVDYKGNTSYRNAAKWVRTKSYIANSLLNSNKVIASGITEAISVLTSSVNSVAACAGSLQTTTKQGVSVREIERYLANRSTPLKLTKETLEAALDREVSAGNIKNVTPVSYALNTFTVDPPQPEPLSEFIIEPAPNPFYEQEESQDISNHTDGKFPRTKHLIGALKQVPGKRGRPASKRKRFKKTHGPDFVETSSIPSSDSKDELRCDYCLMTSDANRNGDPEDLLVCKDCNAKAHPTCMEYSPELAIRSRMSPWQCIDCKTCSICDDSGDGDCMLFCDLCDKGYHMSCHIPKVTTKPIGKWACNYCSKDPRAATNGYIRSTGMDYHNSNQRAALDAATGLPTPCDSPISEDMKKDYYGITNGTWIFEECLSKYPKIVPDAQYWSIENVEKFFITIGFAEQAPAFKDQEIDGKSLLLMKRSDVLTGLSLKLGPALKIYNHVKRLQTRHPDGHLLEC